MYIKCICTCIFCVLAGAPRGRHMEPARARLFFSLGSSLALPAAPTPREREHVAQNGHAKCSLANIAAAILQSLIKGFIEPRTIITRIAQTRHTQH